MSHFESVKAKKSQLSIVQHQ